MNIEILGADSMGARSMATFVEAGGHSFLIDPGVALGPRRYGLPPHRLEFEAKDAIWRLIEERAKVAEFIVITHYHYDHYNPEGLHVFEGKVLFIKDPEKNINKSQKGRASYFLEKVKGIAKEIIVADGKSLKIGDVELVFSEAQPHGYTPRLGCVLQVLIREGNFSFLFTSDIQGAPLKEHLDFLLESGADVVFMDGAPTYLFPTKFSKSALDAAFSNTALFVDEAPFKALVIDHHTTRDIRYQRWFEEIFAVAKEKNKRILTAAEFMGRENLFLEARRRELHKGEGSASHNQV